MKRKQRLKGTFPVPDDVAFKIVSCLEVSDVCSLGSCSRFWREIIGSDHVWKSLSKERWSALVLDKDSSASERESHDLDQQKGIELKGWREFYIKQHSETAKRVADLGKCLSCQPINCDDYLKVIEDMSSMQLGFKDVQIFFLKPEIDVLLNLVGLHYCIKRLGVMLDSVKEAIDNCKIQERQVCVQWCKHGGWIHRFRLPDELHCHSVSLGNLSTTEGEVLTVLDRGVTPQMLRIQISSDIPESTLHSCKSTLQWNY